MLADRVKCAVPNPGVVGVGSTITLSSAPVGFRSFLAGFGGGASAYFVLSDGAGRTLSTIATVNASSPETATITKILWNDRLGSTAGETFSSACLAWCALPAMVAGAPVQAWCGTAGGTANALVLTPNVPVSGYVAGMSFSFLISAVNTGAATLNISGVGAVAIVRGWGGALRPGILRVGQMVRVVFDGTSWRMVEDCSGWVDLGTTVVTTAASAVWALESGFASYWLAVRRYATSVSSNSIVLRVSEDGGSTYKAGATDYGYNASVQSGASFTGSATAGGLIDITAGMLAGDTRSILDLFFEPGSASSIFTSRAQSESVSAGGAGQNVTIAGNRSAAAITTHIQLLVGSGTFSGNFTLFGKM